MGNQDVHTMFFISETGIKVSNNKIYIKDLCWVLLYLSKGLTFLYSQQNNEEGMTFIST